MKGKIIQVKYHEYDSRENIISTKRIRANKPIDTITTSYKYEYTEDEIIKSQQYNSLKEKTYRKLIRVAKSGALMYSGEKERLFRNKWQTSQDSILLKYNAHGKVTSYIHYYSFATTSFEYTYDESQRLISEFKLKDPCYGSSVTEQACWWPMNDITYEYVENDDESLTGYMTTADSTQTKIFTRRVE